MGLHDVLVTHRTRQHDDESDDGMRVMMGSHYVIVTIHPKGFLVAITEVKTPGSITVHTLTAYAKILIP
jgi:hypothetical protein